LNKKLTEPVIFYRTCNFYINCIYWIFFWISQVKGFRSSET